MSHLNYKPLELLAGEEAGPGEGDGDVVLGGLTKGQLVGEVTVVSATQSMTWLQSRAHLRGRPCAVRCHMPRKSH